MLKEIGEMGSYFWCKIHIAVHILLQYFSLMGNSPFLGIDGMSIRAPWHSITCTLDIPSEFTTERSAIVDLPPTNPPPHSGTPQLGHVIGIRIFYLAEEEVAND
ncbi:hypothetical protein LguiA_013059 [Lonicera macranthoides]